MSDVIPNIPNLIILTPSGELKSVWVGDKVESGSIPVGGAHLLAQAATTDTEWRALCEKLVGDLMQILEDGGHITDYVGADETPVFNRNEKQGHYCYAAAEQAMQSLAEAKLRGVG